MSQAYLLRENAAIPVSGSGGRGKRSGWPAIAAIVCLLACAGPAAAEVQERVEPYAISGRTGVELYLSIGERGPKAGTGRRAIAHTNFRLTWQRNYQRQGTACTLVAARPKLVITYTLPKPAGPLPAETQRRWDIFIEGIRRHEEVHGAAIKEMVKRIEQTTIGLSVPDDPGCRKIRKAIVKPLSEASEAQRRQSREFDRIEMGEGGNIQRLIRGLVGELRPRAD
jgi:predicted secreted Zn-dependent protease